MFCGKNRSIRLDLYSIVHGNRRGQQCMYYVSRFFLSFFFDEIRAINPQMIDVSLKSHSMLPPFVERTSVKRRCRLSDRFEGFEAKRPTEGIVFGRQSTRDENVNSGMKGEKRESRYFQTISQRRFCADTVRRDTWNEAPPKRYFGRLNSCQEVVLHVSHLMGLLDSG